MPRVEKVYAGIGWLLIGACALLFVHLHDVLYASRCHRLAIAHLPVGQSFTLVGTLLWVMSAFVTGIMLIRGAYRGVRVAAFASLAFGATVMAAATPYGPPWIDRALAPCFTSVQQAVPLVMAFILFLGSLISFFFVHLEDE